MKRETITAHHGNMARKIVILAESAEVEQDDGFTSALMLCAAAAGDSATSKAILLASEVRKMDHLRTIGGSRPDALDARDGDLQLESRPTSNKGISDGNTNDEGNLDGAIVRGGASNKLSKSPEQNITYGEREYGKDTRVISAFVHSCAQALNKNGLGTIWTGRENLGYLCENSLRLITTRWEPSYRDTSVPGIESTKAGIGALRHVDERKKDYEYVPGKRQKFRGLFVDEDDLATIDDIRGEDDLYSDLEEDDDSFFGDEEYVDSEDCERSGEKSPLKSEEVRGQLSSARKEFLDVDDTTISGNGFGTLENDDIENVEFEDQDSGSNEDSSLVFQDRVSSLMQENTDSSSDNSNSMPKDMLAGLNPDDISKIEDLHCVLPGMPIRRMKKVLDAYDQTLGHPSMLTLVPILRETMPDYVSSGWLKRSNKQNADFALQKASKDGLVDSPLLNSMLEVKANSGSLNEAIEYHQEQFAKHNLVSIECVHKC
jgi:hypothetical protein